MFEAAELGAVRTVEEEELLDHNGPSGGDNGSSDSGSGSGSGSGSNSGSDSGCDSGSGNGSDDDGDRPGIQVGDTPPEDSGTTISLYVKWRELLLPLCVGAILGACVRCSKPRGVRNGEGDRR